MKLFKFRKFFDIRYIPHERRRIQVLACLFVWSVLLCFVYQNYVVGTVRVIGTSMEPTLKAGEKKVYWKWDYLWRQPERGEIVVLKDPKDGVLSVKRVVGLPGERIEMRDGAVWIGGQRLVESYLDPKTVTFIPGAEEGGVELGEKRYFVLGDNRGVSRDSREYGPIRQSRLLGRIRLKEFKSK